MNWKERNSNTSHVIVYQDDQQRNLSPGKIQIHLMLLFIAGKDILLCIWSIFKYISCYCLSVNALNRPAPLQYSNTSHVIVYRHVRCPCRCYKSYSNTSHVIVYPPFPYQKLPEYFIQIHLMLLFIFSEFSASELQWNSNTSHVIVYLFQSVLNTVSF